uniref:Uncharacterized protein n=1 Tax=Kalanchoe fedtschenkoi TaxID=63787 RepID=A0A7N0V470_KALFE
MVQRKRLSPHPNVCCLSSHIQKSSHSSISEFPPISSTTSSILRPSTAGQIVEFRHPFVFFKTAFSILAKFRKAMVTLVSRTGRQAQRYCSDGCQCRQVVGCVPYRYRKLTREDGTTNREVEVLVVRSQKGQGLMFPKVLILLYSTAFT